MIYIVLGLIGAVMGSFYLYGRGDFLLGGAVGLLVAAVVNQRNRLLALEKRLVSMERRIAGTFSGDEAVGPAETTDASEPVQPVQDVPLSKDGIPCPKWKPMGGLQLKHRPTPCRLHRCLPWNWNCPMPPSPGLNRRQFHLIRISRHPGQMAWATRSGNSFWAATSWCGWGWWCCCSDSPFW